MDSKMGCMGSFMMPLANPMATEIGGTLAARAWGLSRALDVLARDQEVDGERVMSGGAFAHGERRALWAGATDEQVLRWCFSNNSGWVVALPWAPDATVKPLPISIECFRIGLLAIPRLWRCRG